MRGRGREKGDGERKREEREEITSSNSAAVGLSSGSFLRHLEMKCSRL